MKRLLIYSLCIFCAVATMAQGGSSAKTKFDQGKAFYKKSDYTKAFPLFLEAAQGNNLGGMLYLGYCYEKGLGTTTNYPKAEEWYLKGAQKADATCALYLANLYASGKMSGKNRVHAASWYLKAANANNAEAQNMMGRYNDEGWPPYKKDEKAAFAWYKKSAENGYAYGQNNYGWYFYHGANGVEKDYNEAVKWFNKSAAQNNSSAYYYLGLCYYFGRGVDKDLNKAFAQFKKATDLGHANAEDWLGFCYREGYGTTTDEKKAFTHFTNAVNKGSGSAQYNLAQCYEKEIGTKEDISKAILWYRKSAANGDKEAQKRLDYLAPDFSKMTAKELYEKVEGYLMDAYTKGTRTYTFSLNDPEPDTKMDELKISYPHAYTLFFEALTKSAQMGYAKAQSDIGSYYFHGEFDFPKDTKTGFSYIEQAAKQHEPSAQYQLGNIYFFGQEGMKKNTKVAFNWYTLSAQNGNKYAMEHLGRCYERGEGTKKEIDKAIMYYEKAGKKEQALKLKKEYNKLTPKDVHDLGLEAYGKEDFGTALAYFEKNVQNNYIPSFSYAAFFYYMGYGTEKNLQKAFELYQKAAPTDNDAKWMTAYMLELGEGTSKNEQKAFQFYKELADKEYAGAYSYLAWCYIDGTGVSKDPKKGFEYHLKAAKDTGFPRDFNNVGWCYLYGKGTAKDYSKALEYFNKAIEAGGKTSYSHIGNCHFYGWGVKQDYQKAISNYRLAIEGNEDEINWNAFNTLGECYLLGLGVEQDYKESVRMFEKSASSEIVYAYFNLSLCYELGLGVSAPNPTKSREYLQKAIDQNANITVQTKGMDSKGNWNENIPATKQNGQTVYTIRNDISPNRITATITNRTVNNITQRMLAYEKMDNKVFRLDLPSIIVSENNVTAANKEPKVVLPSIRIITPFNNAPFSSRKTKFAYYVDTPDDAPILEMIVKVNGELQPTPRSIEAGESIELDLPQTDCSVMFQVRNKYGNSVAEVVNLKWKNPSGSIIKPNLYVLAIGINDYENFTPLKFPVKDMQDFVAAVQTKKDKPYKNIKVKTLTNKEANRRNIEDAFLWLSEEATTIDFTFVYFAGHGTLDDKNRFFLVPVDGDKERLLSTCIRGNHFIEWLNEIPGKVVVFTDACHSGSLTEGTRSASEADISALINLMHHAKSGIALYASSEAENVSKEHPDWGNGAFTKVLLEALSGKAKSKDKNILSTFDLLYYLNDKVHRVSKNQKPQFDVKDDFPLFFY